MVGVEDKYVPFLNCKIIPYRKAGNTTRCVDAAVQILFAHGKVLLVDHYNEGDHKIANNHFTRCLVDRLNYIGVGFKKMDRRLSNYLSFSDDRKWLQLNHPKISR